MLPRIQESAARRQWIADPLPHHNPQPSTKAKTSLIATVPVKDGKRGF